MGLEYGSKAHPAPLHYSIIRFLYYATEPIFWQDKLDVDNQRRTVQWRITGMVETRGADDDEMAYRDLGSID